MLWPHSSEHFPLWDVFMEKQTFIWNKVSEMQNVLILLLLHRSATILKLIDFSVVGDILCWSHPDSPTLKQQLENSNDFSKTAFTQSPTQPHSFNVVVHRSQHWKNLMVAMMSSSQTKQCIAICWIWGQTAADQLSALAHPCLPFCKHNNFLNQEINENCQLWP